MAISFINTKNDKSTPIGGIKKFATIEEMNKSSENNEGDLAIVYRNEIQNMTLNSQLRYITFPETVILPETFTRWTNLILRSIDESEIPQGDITLDQDMMQFNVYKEDSMIRVVYTSTDGITYAREEFMVDNMLDGSESELKNPVDLGAIVVALNDTEESWDDALGYFIQVEDTCFEGLYQYTNGKWQIASTRTYID